MEQTINRLIRSKNLKNGVWLYVLQMFNTIVPLLTLPYITRILGASQYGLFSISLNWVTYFLVIVEYGFNLTGVRKVAMAENNEEISKIFSRIIYSKLLLCSLSFTIMITILSISNISETQFITMIILFTMVLGEAIRQTWLFQGLQDMRSITIISVISRTTSTLLIFLFIKNSDQVYLYSALYAITFLLIGMLSLLVVRKHFKIKMVRITIKELIEELKDGWYIFTSTAMSRIFTGIGITILGLAGTETDVGIYSAIQKIPLIMTLMYMPISQVIYPYISQKYALSIIRGTDVLKKITKYIVLVFSCFALIIILFSKQIVFLLYGEEYTAFALLLIPLVLWSMIGIVNNLLGIQFLVASGHQKEYSSAFQIGILANVILNITLGMLWNKSGIALAAMLSELILTIALLYHIRKILTD